MSKQITRRDFLNGVSVGIAGTAMIGPQNLLAEAVKSQSGIAHKHYPPTLNGIRGSHEGSFEVSHALAWRQEKPSSYAELKETYDVVVVGAGISGLAAALFYQQLAGQDKRILILDNHDDFGGHARRNEFHTQGKMLLGSGGSGNFQDFHLYSPQAQQLVKDLGFDLKAIQKKLNPQWGLGNLGNPLGLYTDRKHFGKDAITTGGWFAAWFGYGDYQRMINELPLPQTEREKLIQLIEGTRPLAKTLPTKNVRKALKSISYKTFLIDYVGLAEATCTLWDPIMNVTYGVGVGSLSIYEGLKNGLPGLSVLGEEVMNIIMGGSDAAADSDFVWLPDGNATLTRQMVRRLIPQVAPGETVADVVDAVFDYDQLDRPDHPVRLRLNSSAVNATNNSDGSVSVSYVTNGQAYRVRAKHCILACYNGLIPHLCPELPQAQKDNLSYGVKQPLLSVNVLLRNGHPFYNAGSQLYLCPTSYFKMVCNAPPVNIGNYQASIDPDDPMLVYMLTTPSDLNNGNQTCRDLFRLARHKLYNTSFADYEREIREQLTGMFSDTGFDADRDIEAITINRWSHGYSYAYQDLYDPQWPEGQAPHELGRKQHGNISIANSDSEARAYVDAAIDAAWRAVNEQLDKEALQTG